MREEELDIHLPAPGQHHDEERQPAPGVADGEGAILTPVDLGGLAGGKGQGEEGFAATWPDGVDIVLDDADATLVAGIPQALEDLLGGERMGIEPADDLAFEGIQLAGTTCPDTRRIRSIDPVAHGLDVESQTLGQLHGGEVLGDAIADGAPGGVVDHDRPPRMACSRAKRVATGAGSGQLST